MVHFPKISIVTPNYNGEKYLEQTIQSVLSQNYPNLEYIIIDGGSTDNSVAIIKKYEKELVFWVSEPDKGLYDAIQKGFEKSTGEIMAWINSDDLYQPNAFFMVAEIFKFKEVNWLQGIPSAYDEKGRTVKINSLKRWSNLDYYIGNYKWIQQESVFWRRTLWEVSGKKMATEMKYAGDLELWLRFFRHEKLYVTSALLGGFRFRTEGQLSFTFMKDYLAEANGKIKDEIENKLTNSERKIVKRIQKHSKIVDIIPKGVLKEIVNKYHQYTINKIRKKHFKYPPLIIFDRIDQEFKINT
jgi:glycosyltransferase involved in cell wall biosynthesis